MSNQNKNGFTLVELLAVIVILAIILAIAIPGISTIINSASRSSLESSAKMVLKAIEYKMLEDNSFNYKAINELNVKSILSISDDNYEKLTLEERDGKPYIIIVGKNKWDNFTAFGSSSNVDVDEGLVLWLDASSTNSYPGTGSIWYDLSKSASDVTLNGAVYSSTNGGIITFDGVDDYVDFYAPNLGNTATVEMWCKLASAYTGGKMLFGWGNYDLYSTGCVGFNTAVGDCYGVTSAVFSTYEVSTKWIQYVFEMRSNVSYTNNKIYINGDSQTLSQVNGAESVSGRNFNNGNGRISGWRTNASYRMPMSCANFKVYNRSLSVEEIRNGYNAMKNKFGM